MPPPRMETMKGIWLKGMVFADLDFKERRNALILSLSVALLLKLSNPLIEY